MTDMYIKGPDALKLLSAIGVNSFANFAVGQGQAVRRLQLRRLRDRRRDPLLPRRRAAQPRRPALGAQLGAVPLRDRRLRRDVSSATSAPPSTRTTARLYRYQVQGPNALEVLEKVNGGPLPEIKFFNMGEITIAGRKVRALHHGMSGVPGLELFGPWEEGDEVRAAIVEAGEEFGLAPGRLARLRDEHARVGLDPVPAAGGLHRRRHEGVPRVAARERATRAPARSAAASTRTTSRTTT